MQRNREIYSPMANVLQIKNSRLEGTPSKTKKFEKEFEIIKKIGEGCFGEAFSVKSKVDGRFYAIKKSKERYSGLGDRTRKLEEVKKAIQLTSKKPSPSKSKT